MFDVNLTMGFQVINFFLLLYCLYRIGYKPVYEMMEKRRQTIQNNLEGAEKEKQDATDLRAEYEEHLANARKEAQQIIENANRFSEKAKEEMITAAREESERLRIQAEKQIAHAKEKALVDIRNEVVQLSVVMAEKIISKEMDEKKHSDLIHEVIGKIDRESVGNLPC